MANSMGFKAPLFAARQTLILPARPQFFALGSSRFLGIAVLPASQRFASLSKTPPAQQFRAHALAIDHKTVDLDWAALKSRSEAPHFKGTPVGAKHEGKDDCRLPHAVWSDEELAAVQITHLRPHGFVDHAAYYTVQLLRQAYDLFTGYKFGAHSEKCMLRRVTILETVAGVPGMVGAMNRHLRSLRKIKRDYGWIHTLLEEAENERMHLMTALLLRRPSWMCRAVVITAQAGFLTWYTIMYALSPRYCHRFVGYLEEEAVKTYTGIVQHIDEGKLPEFLTAAPPASRAYWALPDNATLRDVFLAIRADESHHREVNHTFASMKEDDPNPFPSGY